MSQQRESQATPNKRDPLKVGITLDSARKKREEQNEGIRKSKREDDFQKRRNLFGTGEENASRHHMDSISHNGNLENLSNIGKVVERPALDTDNEHHFHAIHPNGNNNNNQIIYDESVMKEIQMLPQYAMAVYNGSDKSAQLQAIVQIRKLLSVEKNPPIDAVIKSNVAPVLVDLLKDVTTKVVFESAWVLTNIASGNADQTRYLVELNAVPAFISLLVTAREDDLREQAIWALGNIAGDSPAMRDLVMSHQILNPLLHILTNSKKISILRNATWTLSNLCRGKPTPPLEVLAPALPVLNQLIRHTDMEVMIDACWALSYLTEGSIDRIQIILSTGCANRLVPLLNHPSYKIQVPCLRAVGNIITGNEAQTKMLLDLNVLPLLYRLIQSPRKGIRKEACWTISNIVIGSFSHCQSVVSRNVMPMVVKVLSSSDFDVKREAAFILANVLSWKSPEHVHHLVTVAQCVKPLCDLLAVQDNKLVYTILESFEVILAAGEALTKKGQVASNPYVSFFEEAEGVEKLEKLQEHENTQIYGKALHILENYFGASTSDEVTDMAPASTGQTFVFGFPTATPQQPNTFSF